MLCVIAAHPDDAELGAGGWLAQEGGLIICTTNGENHSRDAETAFNEQGTAAHLLGVEFEILPCIEPWVSKEIVGYVDDILSRFAFEAVITHSDATENTEHGVVSQIALAAARTHDNVLMMEPVPPDRGHFKPQFYVDISDVATKKYRSIGAYQTQIVRHGRNLIKTRKALDAWRGAEIGCQAAEAYQVVRWNHEPRIDATGAGG